MPRDPSFVSFADIARLAGGVTSPAVANWRKRFDDFPAPVGKDGRTPLFNREEVVAWLSANNKLGSTDDQLSADLWQVADMIRSDGAPIRNLLSLIVAGDGETLVDQATLGAYSDLVARHGERAVVDALLSRIVRASGRQFAGYDTHPNLNALIGTISDTPDGATIYDPCVGMGSTLQAVAAADSTVYGQDINETVAAIANKVLELHAIDATIATGDVLSDDHFPDVLADRVVANPPFGLRLSTEQIDQNDPRWIAGTRGLDDATSAFIQIALAHLAPQGRAILQVPPGWLFRPRGEVSEYLVRNNLLDAVIMLPGGLAGASAIKSCLVVIDRDRPPSTPARPTPILFVDTEHTTQHRGLPDDLLRDLQQLWANWDHQEIDDNDARAVTLTEIVENRFDLTPNRYLRSADFDWPRGANSNADRSAAVELADAQRTLTNLLTQIPAPTFTTPPTASGARTVRLGDLRSLKVIRGTSKSKNPDETLRFRDLADHGQNWEIQNPPVGDDVESGTTVLGDLIVHLVAHGSGAQPRVARITDAFVGREVGYFDLILRVPSCDLPEIFAEYLYFWLTSPVFAHHLDIYDRGVAAPRISRRDLMNFEFPLTGLDDQLALIRAMETQDGATKELARHLTRSHELVDRHQQLLIEQAAADIMRNTR